MKNYCTPFLKKYSLPYLIIAVLAITIPVHSMERLSSPSQGWQTAKMVGKVVGGIAVVTALYIGTCMGYTAWYRHCIQVKKRTEDKRVLPKPAEPKPWAAVEERYRKELEKEDKQIMHKFLTTLGASQEKFEEDMVKAQENYIKALEETIKEELQLHTGPASPLIKETITSLLQQQGIDPAIVHIVRNDSADSNMSIKGGIRYGKARLMVNEKCFTHFSQRYLEQVILHEIQHLKNNDNLMSSITTANEQANGILHEHRLFREKRADILASLNSVEHAQAALEYNFVPKFAIPAVWAEIKLKRIRYDEHPDYITRSLYLKKLHKEMHACVEQQKKAKAELVATH